ncbi:MAG TPA: hypothetical protein VHC69_33895 [Polyangiaceae bacterium]|nr:hypothetical protein [Polyangiaceae bacterium]HVW30415.1 hypothetical protein [Polyangiaceae bacterium]
MTRTVGLAGTHLEDCDLRDFPPAIICVTCGRTDCLGCVAPARREAATPWEAGGEPVLRRLWKTARLATVDGEAFFGGLPDGSVFSALGFALSCEMLAIASLALAWFPIVYALVPEFVQAVATDQERRGAVAVALSAAVPLLALMMVVLHVLWAGGLELGLRLAGAKGRASHCLRYALYSCGWDLVTSPFGFAAGWLSSGLAGAAGELRAAVRIPRFATVAYIGRARNVSERRGRRALRVAAMLTGSVVLAGAVALGVALVVVFM